MKKEEDVEDEEEEKKEGRRKSHEILGPPWTPGAWTAMNILAGRE